MDRIFLTPPLELLMHFLVVVGFVLGVWWLFSMVMGLAISAVGLLVLFIIRMICLTIKAILKFIFPWAFRSQVRKGPIGFHPTA